MLKNHSITVVLVTNGIACAALMAQPVVWGHFNMDAVFPAFLDVVQKAIGFRDGNEVSTILRKLKPLHRRMVFNKALEFLKPSSEIK